MRNEGGRGSGIHEMSVQSKAFLIVLIGVRGGRNDTHREGSYSLPAEAEVLEYRVRLSLQAEVTGRKK